MGIRLGHSFEFKRPYFRRKYNRLIYDNYRSKSNVRRLPSMDACVSHLWFLGFAVRRDFSGATQAKFIRDSIGVALIVFLIALWLFVPRYQNHGLWIAFVVFSLSRSFFLSLFIPKLTREKFTNKN